MGGERPPLPPQDDLHPGIDRVYHVNEPQTHQRGGAGGQAGGQGDAHALFHQAHPELYVRLGDDVGGKARQVAHGVEIAADGVGAGGDDKGLVVGFPQGDLQPSAEPVPLVHCQDGGSFGMSTLYSYWPAGASDRAVIMKSGCVPWSPLNRRWLSAT